MSDEILFEIQRSLGRIEQKIDNNATTLTAHTARDEEVVKAIWGRLEGLQLAQASQKGYFTALAGVGSTLGAGVGGLAIWLIEKYLNHR